MSKKEQVRSMFNNIAGRYDFLNHFLSVGIDYLWRKKVIRILKLHNPKKILDVATGTADLAIETAKIGPDEVVGVDIADQMLEHGRKKISKKKLDEIIILENGDSEALRFESNSFDAVTVAFGVRNFENLDQGLREMYRILKPGGIAVILEFSNPRKFPVKQLYDFYFKNILPLAGRIISKHESAYNYLPESVGAFPDGNNFLEHMHSVKFKNTSAWPLTFGIASIYTGRK
ncbi:MAG: bifunctional demethylmenaquinone methyltransferase/2-methoxy-6-polyprenyl-1,4-benzoquinol methylase UbiE [Bacteroidales bacterium]|nr:bifunctional demethylmenaquinone methyltransferase/2-methoxy-6-polyprenyl-1,4-benzoquinol methylase UbiE [Bacteroidales bacterium]MCF8334366.1 bifunctional demethylmenaquinone methyltransferase/2-methoxy-6-polyprenyl-1,4-benzoquinol methylase UbiE [Bacteroidales bacterium]